MPTINRRRDPLGYPRDYPFQDDNRHFTLNDILAPQPPLNEDKIVIEPSSILLWGDGGYLAHQPNQNVILAVLILLFLAH